jgi:hypothetical protein
MDPYEEQNFRDDERERAMQGQRVPPNRWLIAGLVALLGVTGIAGSYAVHERNEAQWLAAEDASSKTAMSQLQTQVNTLTARLNDMSAAQSANSAAARPTVPTAIAGDVDIQPPAAVTGPAASIAPPPAIAHTAKPAPPKTASAKRKPARDKRYVELKAQLDDQKKQLKQTQDDVAKNRADLEGSISSTRDDLNGSIAKTHGELVVLEKRGERSYFEFDLTKSKNFQRVGPMSLSLRKADTKHKSYDLAMLVDDNELNKKKVNLYEPVWIHSENGGQPVQIVVNHIGKDEVRGYVSAPKYKQSELATLSSSNPTASGTDSKPAQQTPQQ